MGGREPTEFNMEERERRKEKKTSDSIYAGEQRAHSPSPWIPRFLLVDTAETSLK